MKIKLNVIWVLLGTLMIVSCSRKADFTPREINFDRDICINCLMGLADQKFSAQSINNRNEVIWFDDLGCLVAYMKTPDWETFGGDEVVSYIGDAATGEWVKVEDAWYVYGTDTPMGYGYAAYREKNDSAFDFKTTVERINQGITMREDFLKKKQMLHHDMN
ncbi:hypothetical protein MASR1M74_05850 [Lentimicrobium sp.]